MSAYRVGIRFLASLTLLFAMIMLMFSVYTSLPGLTYEDPADPISGASVRLIDAIEPVLEQLFPAYLFTCTVLTVLWVAWLTYVVRSSSPERAPKLVGESAGVYLPPKKNYFEENRKSVIGWETADEEDQKYLPPEELQSKIDDQNPLGDSIRELKVALNNAILHPKSESWLIRRRRERLERKIIECREAYVAFRVDQLTRGDDELITWIEREVAHLLKR